MTWTRISLIVLCMFLALAALGLLMGKRDPGFVLQISAVGAAALGMCLRWRP